MSTFNGIVDEFPQIRIDFFRTSPAHPPPLACFLSHIHSDHLQGLESLRSPLVYCSSATRCLLLQLEKYPNRINFARGILESRRQHYKHLKTVLRPIPLNCPTEIELGNRRKIRVTLFDANHCPGAVMFLIEGDGKAVLYTGDIRAEAWWVNQIARNPVLIPYGLGERRLDRVYLDTTFAVNKDLYRTFPSKAEGLRELLGRIQMYPPQTLFHLRAWTLGYEEVWQAMSALLCSQVHVDEYQMRLYGSLSSAELVMSAPEAPILNGFVFGNKTQNGCLTKEQETRLHSCEPGTECHARLSETDRTVWIFPIVTRTPDGTIVPEVGAGGGGGDLYQVPELDTADAAAIVQLEELCSKLIDDPDTLRDALQKLSAAKESSMMRLSLEGLEQNSYGDYSVEDMISLIASKDFQQNHVDQVPFPQKFPQKFQSKIGENGLPNVIRFPYSRHSSHSELRHLISTFRPKDIYPCTFDAQNWTEECSIERLFGDLCSERVFSHDRSMRILIADRQKRGTPERKRKRDDEDDKLATSDIESTQSAPYETAERLPRQNLQSKEHSQDQSLEVDVEADTITQISAKGVPPDPHEHPTAHSQVQSVSPSEAPAFVNIPNEGPEQIHPLDSYTSRQSSSSSFTPSPPLSPNTRLRNIKNAYDRLHNPPSDPQLSPSDGPSLPPSDIPQLDGPADNPSPPPSTPNPTDSPPPSSSPLTLSTSCFDSQQSQEPPSDVVSPDAAEKRTSRHRHAASARKAAYRAARAAALNDGADDDGGLDGAATASNGGGGGGRGRGFGSWEMFATVSGGNSHTEPEGEL